MDAAAIQRVLIIGAGTCGQQIALQFARFGYEVTVYDAHADSVHECRKHLEGVQQRLVRDGVVSGADSGAILSRIHTARDAREAASTPDLLIESVPEDLRVKRDVLARFHQLSPAKTICTTNSSYLLPSSLASASGRPDRFAAYHFQVPVWRANAVDIMAHERTSPEVIETLCDLAQQRLGRESNHGFYRYPDPAFAHAWFRQLGDLWRRQGATPITGVLHGAQRKRAEEVVLRTPRSPASTPESISS